MSHFPKWRMQEQGDTLVLDDIYAPKPRKKLATDQIQWIYEPSESGTAMLRVLIGIGLWFLLFTNPNDRQITGELLRAATNAIAPPIEGKDAETPKEHITDALTDQD